MMLSEWWIVAAAVVGVVAVLSIGELIIRRRRQARVAGLQARVDRLREELAEAVEKVEDDAQQQTPDARKAMGGE
ncbi:hypothetical protein Ae406Ps2_0885 [Pseudonocardia sp. Ae406_Ps2]|uniref:hypothetical protein n=1 Tax=unclassified Pseudonocardia TaxID=2619320 RepID=UPI00094AB8F8|nr:MULTISPECIES: hypothetical protein [unclassified Pseudonocardia]OLM00885.1 hypothetical protein Ae406Ps2_0885 [Pseudonocardia sp. Ae406_Ps2]OLM07324.1 hypothetical protein Ae331Ps2_5034c [Pseudonocardia sp. Ae331_Ps2]OLM14512.1 hypothetical protein Ae505Ps2_4642c [Pseudonocardia sp. Ae505_Ps2]OLM22463.1 hypothetical protein Ae706Ps2_0895 [Pseudonocardia sp. Ae706_Ps2]